MKTWHWWGHITKAKGILSSSGLKAAQEIRRRPLNTPSLPCFNLGPPDRLGLAPKSPDFFTEKNEEKSMPWKKVLEKPARSILNVMNKGVWSLKMIWENEQKTLCYDISVIYVKMHLKNGCHWALTKHNFGLQMLTILIIIFESLWDKSLV